MYIFYILLILIIFYIIYYLLKKNKFDEKECIREKFIEKYQNSNIKNINKESILVNKNQIKKDNQKDLLYIDFLTYQSPKKESYNFLERNLSLYSSKNNIEHFTSSEESKTQDIATLFPDTNKSAYGLSSSQNQTDLLKSQFLDIDMGQVPDSLKNIETRPSEEVTLDDALNLVGDNSNLLRKTLVESLTNSQLLSNNLKIGLYYDLFTQSVANANAAKPEFDKLLADPSFLYDANFKTKIGDYLSNSNSFSTLLNTYYLEMKKVESSLVSDVSLKNSYISKLNALNIPSPVSTITDEENIGNEDDLDKLRSLADDIDSFYDICNSSIVPYYNYMYDLNIVPLPTTEDGNLLATSFSSDMIELTNTYNSIITNYVTNNNIYTLLVQGTTADYINNVLKLKNLKQENLDIFNKAVTAGQINSTVIQGIDQSIIDITNIFKFMSALYTILQQTMPKPDIEKIRQTVNGTYTYEGDVKKASFVKIADPISEGEPYTFGMKDMNTGTIISFKSLIHNFSREVFVPPSPTKEQLLAASAVQTFSNMYEPFMNYPFETMRNGSVSSEEQTLFTLNAYTSAKILKQVI